jgi:hypothetical protein
MTRHGTLAYYLAAWVIGCFVISSLLWLTELLSGASGLNASVLLMTYFFALIFGALNALFFAFLLRKVMRLWNTYAVWSWLVAGGALGFILMLLLARADDAWIRVHAPLSGPAGYVFQALLLAPDALRRAGPWQAPVGGAITALVLCLVDRAFARNEPTAETETLPAA